MTTWLLMLAVSAGLSMNLVLQFGFGIREITLAKKSQKGDAAAVFGLPLMLVVFFASVLLLWMAFSFVRSMLPLGFLEYVLVFPVSLLVFSGWEYLSRRHLSKGAGSAGGRGFLGSLFAGKHSPGDVFGGGALAGAALFMTLVVAGGLVDALVLSLGFTLGTLLAVVIVAEIRRRAAMEAVPGWLRGAPLTLVAMGLLSLVFSSAAMVLFEVLGGG